jgi:hypothetical protein
MRDAIADIVHCIGQNVKRLPIGAHQHKILDIPKAFLHAAAHLIMKRHRARTARHFEPDHVLEAGGLLFPHLLRR